jgi:hypothetical protein
MNWSEGGTVGPYAVSSCVAALDARGSKDHETPPSAKLIRA